MVSSRGRRSGPRAWNYCLRRPTVPVDATRGEPVGPTRDHRPGDRARRRARGVRRPREQGRLRAPPRGGRPRGGRVRAACDRPRRRDRRRALGATGGGVRLTSRASSVGEGGGPRGGDHRSNRPAVLRARPVVLLVPRRAGRPGVEPREVRRRDRRAPRPVGRRPRRRPRAVLERRHPRGDRPLDGLAGRGRPRSRLARPGARDARSSPCSRTRAPAARSCFATRRTTDAAGSAGATSTSTRGRSECTARPRSGSGRRCWSRASNGSAPTTADRTRPAMSGRSSRRTTCRASIASFERLTASTPTRRTTPCETCCANTTSSRRRSRQPARERS